MKQRVGIFIPEQELEEIKRLAARFDRSPSWVVRQCVRAALHEIRKLPTVPNVAFAPQGAEEAP